MSSQSESSESGATEYRVERIVDRRTRNGKIQYRIKWLNWPDEDNTWEPEENCVGAAELIRVFEANRRSRSRQPRGRQSTRGRRESARSRNSRESRRRASELHDDLDNATQQLENLSFNGSNEVSNVQNDTTAAEISSVPDPSSIDDNSVSSSERNNDVRRATANRSSIRNISPPARVQTPESITPPRRTHTPQTISPPRSSPLIDESVIRRCTEEEIVIVGAEPTENGIIVGIRLRNDDNVFRFSTEEVVCLWPHRLRCFYEDHIEFDAKRL